MTKTQGFKPISPTQVPRGGFLAWYLLSGPKFKIVFKESKEALLARKQKFSIKCKKEELQVEKA